MLSPRRRSWLRRVYAGLKNMPAGLMETPFRLRLGHLAHKDLILKQHTGILLSCQFDGSVFSSQDVMVTLLAIESIFGKNTAGLDLYRQMMETLHGPDAQKNHDGEVSRLKDLTETISKRGLLPTEQIGIDVHQRLKYGADLMAVALYLKIKEVPLRVEAGGRRRPFDMGWLQRAGFSSAQTGQIETRQRELFREWGLIFPVILWPPVQTFFDEIEKDLSMGNHVVCSRDVRFEDQAEFDDLVGKIYAWEGISDSLVGMKIRGMTPYPLVIRVMNLEVPDPGFDSGRGEAALAGAVKYFKEDIRRKYARRVDNYFRDIVMHMGDSPGQNLHIMRVLDEINGPTRPGEEA